MNRLFKDLTVTDAVTLDMKILPSIPAGANPFRHDLFNMGTELARGWMVMHTGNSGLDNPLPLKEMILINRNTGQRFKVKIDPIQPVERDVVDYIESMDTIVGSTHGFFKPVLKEENCIEWVQQVNPDCIPASELADKVFVCMGPHFVRYSLLLDRDAYSKELEFEYQDPVDDTRYTQCRDHFMAQMATFAA